VLALQTVELDEEERLGLKEMGRESFVQHRTSESFRLDRSLLLAMAYW